MRMVNIRPRDLDVDLLLLTIMVLMVAAALLLLSSSMAYFSLSLPTFDDQSRVATGTYSVSSAQCLGLSLGFRRGTWVLLA